MIVLPGSLRTKCCPQAGILLRNQRYGLQMEVRMRELECEFDIALFLQSPRTSVKQEGMAPRSLTRAEEQVRAGVAGDPSELANDVLRCLRDQQRRPFEITPQLEAWLLESADQPATPLTKADFDGIRHRARKRNSASKVWASVGRTISLQMLSANSISRR
jgi:hypothetical protein